MALNDIGNLPGGHAVLAKYFLHVFGHLHWITEGEPIAFMIPIVINAMFDDSYRCIMLQQRPDQVKVI
jgi:hypothetical protein